MINVVRKFELNLKNVAGLIQKSQYCQTSIDDTGEFRVLNLKGLRSQRAARRQFKKAEVMPPRSKSMPVDQDWGNVWPGPKTFHPASVPLPLRQGFVPKGQAPPGKFGNAELMKIPNFLHLTPPVIKRQCEALKQFCTQWPKGLESEEKQNKHFPVTVISSDYCHSGPTIRNPLGRIVTLKVKLSDLPLDKHARDKFLRLVGDRHDPDTDILTLVVDRCPLRKQNYDYGMYLLTALFHESWVTEPWEADKSEADMEYYDWQNNASRKSVIAIHNFGQDKIEESLIPNIVSYSEAVSNIMNHGENDASILKYKEEVKKMFNL
ncbi:28S ribosomal protein S35, mitochondrial-like [Ctenocephalides felis]|uniref:28S ribosomal protein S35, mitochondrial-like n=1 Tax=Ctenocephalides felis TaxID=7515 RepID=UPI000E6E4AF0|nr:28S ribosomal protein S35, mitochondrial-like [Ctenocephalides felis]XP_026469048.1 28S ribosomal protein S35, mitochondrial-like [Ctenocephalides felis]